MRPFGEIAEFRNGVNYVAEDRQTGIGLFNVKDFQDRVRPDYDGLDQVALKVVPAKAYLQQGDILFVRSNGNKELIGRSLFLNVPPREPVSHSAFTIRARITSGECYPQFYGLYCRSGAIRRALSNQGSGTNISNLNQDILARLPVPVVPYALQRRIADILSAYDDLIENNTRRIAILEDMARRLFDEWFGQHCIPPVGDHRAGLPDGWTAATLSDWVTDLRDAVDPNSLDPATAYVGLEHLPRRSTTLCDWGTAGDVGSTKLRYQQGDILFGKIRPYFHKVAVMPAEGVCSSDAIVMRPKTVGHLPMAIGLTSSDAFVAHATQTSNGTKMPRADWKVLKEYPLPIPDIETLNKYNGVAQSWLDFAATLAASNTNLRTTRDLLLPKLISGEIEVRAAEEELEAAAA